MENIHVMVVDNDPNDEIITLKALQLNKIKGQVMKMRDGVMVLDYLIREQKLKGCRRGHTAVLLLLDLNMPGMTGLEMLTRLRAEAETNSLPVVITSASTDHREIDACLAAGANGYLHKSIRFDEFVKNMGEIISQCMKGCAAAAHGASGERCPDVVEAASLPETGVDPCSEYG